MDFRGRGTQQNISPAQPAGPAGNSGGIGVNQTAKYGNTKGKLPLKTVGLALLALLLLGAAVAAALSLGKADQAKAIRSDKYQAVFLNNGQVYFGKIENLNDKFIDLQKIYYLQTSGNTQENAEANSGNVSLVKLGCELHAPYDRMLINNEQVIFWENLQDSSQVVKAINEYAKQNPKEQNCTTASQNSTQQAPANNTQQPAAAPTGNGNQQPAGNQNTNNRP